MSTLRISDAPLLPDVDGTEKIPTGGRGDYAISIDQIKGHIFQDIGKELVGLGNVDNTSDLDKPVSTAQQTALNLKADKTYVDANLDLKADKTNVYTRSETSLALSKKADLVGGVIPENQIPSSFNDVLEFTTPNLPVVGESGKIYVTTDNNKTWRWSGNKYVEISGWNPDSVSKVVTLPTYYTKEVGVDPLTGVADGAYFNVRSSSDESYVDEYQNVGGVATPTGKSYPSSNAKWDAIQVVDGDRNQHEINNNLKNIHTLKSIKNPIEGQEFVTDEYLPGMGVGGGTYVFQKASSKPNRYGVWVRDNADTGAWVLISELYFEHFGVVEDGTSQSTKIQACIDYAHESQIYEYGFEKVGNYSVSESIVFKPLLKSEITTYFSTESRVSVKTKGSTFLPTQNNVTIFKVLRDHVYIDSIASLGNGKLNITQIQIGRVPSDPTYTSEYRHSACFFKTDEITATSVDTGIMFGTAGFASYYYDIGSIVYRDVTHGMIFENDPDQLETVTRSNINSFKHNGGACSLIGLNLETLTINSFFSENLNAVSSKYPAASKRAIYIPRDAFYEGSGRQNHTIKITGSTEDVPLPVYCKASNCEINIYSAYFDFAAPDAFVGYFNSGRSGWGSSASLCTDMRDFVFPYFSYRAAPLGIVTGSPGVASLPDGITEAYGAVEWQPTGVYNIGGIQTLKITYPFVSEWIRTTIGETVATTTFGEWIRIDKPKEVQVNNVANDTDCNTLKVAGTEKTYYIYYTGSVSGVNSPAGGEFLGVIKWIGAPDGNGVQIAYGIYPNIIKRRTLYSGSWSVWKTVQEI